MKGLLSVWPSVALTALILLAWEAGCRIAQAPSYLLPAPSAIGAAMAQSAPLLLESALGTLAMALQALVAAFVFAAALALLGGQSPLFRRAFAPLAAVIQVTPVIAIAPLFVIWAGLDHPERAIVALGAIVAFFPIYSGFATGLSSADPDLERLFDLYGAKRSQRLWRLYLPSALPFVIEGTRVGASLAIVGVVVAEFVAGSGAAQGLAWRILEASHQLKTPQMFAALVVLGLLGAGLNFLLSSLERTINLAWKGR